VKIAVLNGPNLNLLGTREPAVYGTTTLADIERRMRVVARELGVDLSFAQHNGEGDLIDAIHALRGTTAGAIVNAGAYSHSSLAIRDALTAVAVPFVELHLTNVYAREPERRHSMLAPAARAVVCGFGPEGYEWALRGLVGSLSAQKQARNGTDPVAGGKTPSPADVPPAAGTTPRRKRRG
jgi:3-dehydroquinate dehydratase II